MSFVFLLDLSFYILVAAEDLAVREDIKDGQLTIVYC